jgi:hypothetical protein
MKKRVRGMRERKFMPHNGRQENTSWIPFWFKRKTKNRKDDRVDKLNLELRKQLPSQVSVLKSSWICIFNSHRSHFLATSNSIRGTKISPQRRHLSFKLLTKTIVNLAETFSKEKHNFLNDFFSRLRQNVFIFLSRV